MQFDSIPMKNIITLLLVLVAFTVQAQSSLTNPNETQEIEVSIYPNPSTEFITIQSNQEIAAIEIYNVIGQFASRKKIYKRKKRKKKVTLNVNRLPHGVYYVRIETETEQTVQRIIVQ